MGVVGSRNAPQPLTENKMKVLAVLLLSGLAAGGGFGGGDDWKMYKHWTTMKARESCYGEENMKIYTVKMKTAIAKCYQQDAPELNLPPFKSPYRFINTLMTSADEMEQSQMMFMFKFMKSMMEMNHDKSHYMSFDDHEVKPYSMEYNKNSWMEKMMKKMAMKKMMEKFMNKDHDNMNFNMFDSMKSDMFDSMKTDMFDFDHMDKFGSHDAEYSADQMMDMFQSKIFEDKMKENMMKYKMQQMRSNEEYNPFNKNTYRERMAALLKRHKRQAAPGSQNKNGGAITLPESLDLGDRLADKLMEEKSKMEAKVGNMTCVLREIGILNQNNELDFNTMKRQMDDYKYTDEWVKERCLDDTDMCLKMAKSLPSEAQQDFNFPGIVNGAQVKTFMRCKKYAEMKTCMYKDVKEKLEKNFGSLDKILEQTQLTEDQLFSLVIKLLHGDEMEYYSY